MAQTRDSHIRLELSGEQTTLPKPEFRGDNLKSDRDKQKSDGEKQKSDGDKQKSDGKNRSQMEKNRSQKRINRCKKGNITSQIGIHTEVI